MTDELVVDTKSSWIWGWLNWTSSSLNMLRAAEKKILSYLKRPYRGWYVDVGSVVGQQDKIWTISMNTESPKTPLVLLHGLGSGVALWVLNLDALANNRPVYAIDLLGFGRSSRPEFDRDALKVEKQLVSSVEEWRREMNIKEMILLGHSMGGFLAASYTITYPERVKHLILADPWGFPEKPEDVAAKYNMPVWVKVIGYAMQPFNPLWALRAAGPFGQWVIEKTRPDLTRKFTTLITDENVIPQYIHQCNAQKPTGESAFHTMMSGFGWAKHPMINRMHGIREDIPITLLYGSRSWIDNANGNEIKKSGHHNYVNIQIISGAGHHVYADKAEIFNRYVNDACKYKESDDQLVRTNSKSNAENTESDLEDRDESVKNRQKRKALPSTEENTTILPPESTKAT